MIQQRKRRILVIEDDAAIRRGISDAVRFDGFDVIESANGDEGMDMALGADCELILLDLVLPGFTGLDILREVRKARPTLPVVILSAKGEEKDRITGLQLGADDYVVKPFSVKELLARVQAVLRRSAERPIDINEVSLPNGSVDLDRCEVQFDSGERSTLSERELELMRYLACNPGRAISRAELLRNVWRLDPTGIETRTVDMHIARLRDKLHDSKLQQVIVTVRGKGYMLAAHEREPQVAAT